MANQSPSDRSKKTASSRYPEVLVKGPASGVHQQSFIILHGRGSDALTFGAVLLETPIPGYGNLASAFPNAKFIFPTASKRRARIYKRSLINQWFDNWSLATPEQYEELQNDGLRETSKYIHGLVKAEVEKVGASNVVLGGLSQGCAASLVSLLLWEGETLAAGVGMCGWLPYRKKMEAVLRNKDIGASSEDEDEDEGDDIFQRAGDDQNEPGEAAQGDKEQESNELNDLTAAATIKTDTSPVIKAVEFLRDEIEFPRTTHAAAPADLKLQNIPLFLGHGVLDEKVSIDLGRSAAGFLEAMGVDVQWKEYASLGHWYSEDMLRDMVLFLEARTEWKVHR
ncbi:hypothetical protein EPUS_03814 [Endocarpon pusillum Z07020]|uniref:Phospholipase/carboxylesterase/thioesterase domain-containing protein n=1 Tax=Endocarpon pusillum (strain Z07020 / HMAS-L-300199) TaxID=1263415 RepID=U1HTQ6_ENDPU|nr:uncharacterized protein EPUS_03814 [Endocarpon pusillum Z07020]ERF74000.1 hypothetical protein EPUS_03814 [Endocarpon pusillum Z07020]